MALTDGLQRMAGPMKSPRNIKSDRARSRVNALSRRLATAKSDWAKGEVLALSMRLAALAQLSAFKRRYAARRDLLIAACILRAAVHQGLRPPRRR